MIAPEQMLKEARAIAHTDPERAASLWRTLTGLDVSPVWSDAHIDLAVRELELGNNAECGEHARAVLAAPQDRIDPDAAAVAGVLIADVQLFSGQPVDEGLLSTSIEACRSRSLSRWVAFGHDVQARVSLQRGDDATAIAAWREVLRLAYAVANLESVGHKSLQLAKVLLRTGDIVTAREVVNRALAALEADQLRGPSARLHETKLRQLLSKLASSP